MTKHTNTMNMSKTSTIYLRNDTASKNGEQSFNCRISGTASICENFT